MKSRMSVAPSLFPALLLLGTSSAAFGLGSGGDVSAVQSTTIASPGGKLAATVAVDDSGRLYYRLNREGLPVLEDSPLGVTVDGVDLGAGVAAIRPSPPVELEETYPVRGAHALATNHYTEVSLSVIRGGSGDPSWDMVFRLSDDGLAFRYVIPGQGERTVGGETSGWTLPAGSIIWYQPSTTNYEGDFRSATIGSLEDHLGGPATAVLPEGAGFLTLTEGALRSYSGLSYDAAAGSRLLRARFAQDSSWKLSGGSQTPWRLAIVSPDLDGLVNSDLVANVNPAPDPTLFPGGPHTAWIRPGRAVWSWWSNFGSAYSFEIQRQFVDYARQLGWEYVTVDALWELGFPAEGKTQFDRLRELVDYAHDGRPVDVWVWKSWDEVVDPEARLAFFQQVRRAGAVGVKVDSLSGEGSESFSSVQLYEDILRDAAGQELMINFHGAGKPTGLARTYPNEITREGLKGLEGNALQWPLGVFVTPAHNAALPFTRFVAGAGDYTPVTFDPRKLGETTFTHQLATAGLFTSPLIHFAEDPALLLAQVEVRDLLEDWPTVWDETRVIRGSVIGALAGLARRAGDRWYVFILNGDSQNGKTLAGIDLSFLGRGEYDAIFIADRAQAAFDRQERFRIGGDYRLDATLLPGGGLVARFTPAAARRFRMGFTALPTSYSAAGWASAYGMLRDHADLVAHNLQDGIPWAQALLSSDYRTYPPSLQYLWESLRGADQGTISGHEVLIMLSPIGRTPRGLAPFWAERPLQPLPPPWDQYELDDPHVQLAYLNYVMAAVEFFRPRYVAIGVESNILLATDFSRWAGYKQLNAFIYTAIKRLHPELTVFVTIQYEHMLGLAGDSLRLAVQLQDIYPNVLEQEARALLQHSDLVALSTYPYIGYFITVTPAYYDRALFTARDLRKPLAIAETGYTTRNVFVDLFQESLYGSEEIQNSFLGYLLHAAQHHFFEFVVNYVPADYGTAYGVGAVTLTWAYTGLIREDGAPKPALATWDAFLRLPYARNGSGLGRK